MLEVEDLKVMAVEDRHQRVVVCDYSEVDSNIF